MKKPYQAPAFASDAAFMRHAAYIARMFRVPLSIIGIMPSRGARRRSKTRRRR